MAFLLNFWKIFVVVLNFFATSLSFEHINLLFWFRRKFLISWLLVMFFFIKMFYDRFWVNHLSNKLNNYYNGSTPLLWIPKQPEWNPKRKCREASWFHASILHFVRYIVWPYIYCIESHSAIATGIIGWSSTGRNHLGCVHHESLFGWPTHQSALDNANDQLSRDCLPNFKKQSRLHLPDFYTQNRIPDRYLCIQSPVLCCVSDFYTATCE